MGRPDIRFQIESELHAEYAWTITEWGRFAGFHPVFVEKNPDITVSELGISDIQVSHFFRQQYLHADYSSSLCFKQEPLHYAANGKPDYLSSCFYMLACLQEYTAFESDSFGRFPYEASWQHRLHASQRNLVAEYFTLLLNTTAGLKDRIHLEHKPSRFFLTHDIDTLNGALGEQWRPLIKQGKVGSLLQMMMNHFFLTPDYRKLDKILQIESESDVRSVFFWLTEQGMGKNGIRNADYAIGDSMVKSLMDKVVDKGSVNGLHKSALKRTYSDELEKLDLTGTVANRNHYLRFFMPDTWTAMENAGIDVDTSLGFAEQPGFRAGYGLPFQPFHIKEKRPYQLTEVPLLMMDTSFRYYLTLKPEVAGKHILELLEEHKHDAVLTILWHNNYFLDRAEPGWLEVYKQILQWGVENHIAYALPADLII